MYVDDITHSPSALLTTLTESALDQRISIERFRPPPAQPIALMGVAFDNLALKDAVSRIETMINSRRPHYVVTANVDFLAQARRDAELRRILLDAPLVLCDGTPLVWLSRLFGNRLPQRVAGADVVPELIRVAAKRRYGVFFLGTTDEINAKAISKLRLRFPDLQATHYSPPFRPLEQMNHAEISRRIRLAKPDLLLVAFGCPKAEKWIAMHYRQLGVPVTIGVGATIDFLAGQVRRAPAWMQQGGLEWTYRLYQEPRRLFKRYASDLAFLAGAVLRQWWSIEARSHARHSATRTAIVQVEPTWQRVRAATCLNQDSIEADASRWKGIAEAARHCLLELGETRSIDSTGVAVLIHLQKLLRVSGNHLVLLAPSRPVLRALKAMCLTDCFEIADDALEARAVIAAHSEETLELVT
jgi:N-acetylglucosaminyldiphosphoundecaprenol N-acetyl-beta-D-mannosaminyltransferase